MTLIKKKFYNLFWNNRSCQNLFLLSKEELLDSHILNISEKPINYSFPRIIISNVDKNEGSTHETIKYRTENHNLEMEDTMEGKLNVVEPILVEFYEKRFKKSFDAIVADLDKKPIKFFMQIIKLFNDEDLIEENIIEFLKKYYLIGHNISSFEEIMNFLEKEFLTKKNNLITEENIHLIDHLLNFLKTYYINYSKKRLYDTNQQLVNAIDNKENFKSRINLFHLLYEAKIITNSNEDSHVECVNCEGGVYSGIMKIKIDPNKLDNLKCPICLSKLNYFVPYELNNEIYQIVKEQDGLLLNALCNKTEEIGVRYSTNQTFLNDIEVDCLIYFKQKIFFTECKMYKLSTEESKLKSKLKKHGCKLSKDVVRMKSSDKYLKSEITPLLLVNINDLKLLKEVEEELNDEATLEYPIHIVNLQSIEDILKVELNNSLLKLS